MIAPPEDVPFLRAIVAEPDNDLPRLIFADHLEERGQIERAEWMRLQIHLHHEPLDLAAKARHDELWQESRLNGAPHPWLPEPIGLRGKRLWLSKHDATEIAILRYDQPCRFIFRRGMVSEIFCDMRQILSMPRAVFAEMPVTKVRIAHKYPFQSSTDEWDWSRAPESLDYDPSVIPPYVFSRLDCDWFDSRFKYYSTSERAQNALSETLVSIGRELAWLDPLPRAKWANRRSGTCSLGL